MCRRITHLSIDDCVNAHQCVLLIGTIRLQAVLSRRGAIEHRVAACKINILAASVWGLENKRRSKDKLFFLSTFKDVLAEVKHAFLDSVSLLRDLHVFIHLIKDTSCIRPLCTKIHSPTHRLISFFRKRTVGLLSPLTAGLWSPVCRTGSHGSAGPQTPHMQRFQSRWAAPGKKGQKKIK